MIKQKSLWKEEWAKHVSDLMWKETINWNIPFFDNCRVLKIAILIAIFSLTKGFIWILLRWHCLSWGPLGQRSCEHSEHWARWPVSSPRLSGKLQSRIDDSGSRDRTNWNPWPPSFLNLNVPLIVFSSSHDEHNCQWVFLFARDKWVTEHSWWFSRKTRMVYFKRQKTFFNEPYSS